jgi:hypothetical protein
MGTPACVPWAAWPYQSAEQRRKVPPVQRKITDPPCSGTVVRTQRLAHMFRAKIKRRDTSHDIEVCVRLLDDAEYELRTIRAALASVSLAAAEYRSAAAAVRPAQPLRARPAGKPPPLSEDSVTPKATRRTLSERLQGALSA